MRHIEDQLQKSIVRWFDLQYANLRHLLIHVPNGGYRNAVEAAKFKQMGIELKAGKNRQSVHQKEYEAEFGRIGAKYVVVRSIGEFMKVVNEYLNNV